MMQKFRVWLPDIDQMLRVKALVFEKDKTRCVCGYSFDFYLEDENATIMQSTGLFDKNNKEIFEGDVIANGPDVMYMKRHNTLGFYVEKKGKVEFIADCAVLEEFEEDAKEIADSLEIIGNIYENKDILEVIDEKRK